MVESVEEQVNLDDLRLAKRRLEREVFEAIHAFEDETVFCVREVNLHTTQLCDKPRALTARVETRVEL